MSSAQTTTVPLTNLGIYKQPRQEVFPPSLDIFVSIVTAMLSYFSHPLASLTLILVSAAPGFKALGLGDLEGA